MFFSLLTDLRPHRDLLSVFQTSRLSETKGSICNVKIRFMTQNSQVGGVVKLRVWPELILRPFVWVIKTPPPPSLPPPVQCCQIRGDPSDGILVWSVVTLGTIAKLSPSWCWTRRLPETFLGLLSFICPGPGPRYIKLSSGSSKFASWRTVLLLRMFGFYILIKV